MEDEQAVSITTEGPLSCIAYEMRPVRKARRVPNKTILAHGRRRYNQIVVTCAVIDINIVPQILYVIPRRNPNVAAKRVWAESRCSIWYVTRALKGFVSC